MASEAGGEPGSIRTSAAVGPRLDALPLSLTTRIASYLDRTDALALTFTCRALVPAGESQVYASLDLLFYEITLGGHTDPAIASGGHRPTGQLVLRARALGDALPGADGTIVSDLLQGGLRYFAKLFNRVPERRGYVREMYVDCSQVTEERVDDVRRSITTLGTLRLATKLTLVTAKTWEHCLRALLLCTPHVERLTVLSQDNPAVCYKPDFKVPRLKHFAIEGMSSRMEGLVSRMTSAAQLESLVIMDWRPAWIPARVDAIGERISKRRGTRTLFLPQRCFEMIDPGSLRNVQVLGVQGPFQPTLRFTDLVIPPLPRMRRMFLILNRASTFSPQSRLQGVAVGDPTVHAQRIPAGILAMFDAAPFLTSILYTDLVRPNIRGEVEIRSYVSRAGETFYHARVFSPQFCDSNPDAWSLYRDASGTEGLWQDWTSYRGRLVDAPALAGVYARRAGMPPPGRRLKLSGETWALLHAAAESSQ